MNTQLNSSKKVLYSSLGLFAETVTRSCMQPKHQKPTNCREKAKKKKKNCSKPDKTRRPDVAALFTLTSAAHVWQS